MAKSKAQPARAPAVHRRRTPKADAERWTRILVIGGVIAAILIAGGVIAFGWYQTQIKPLGKTVLQVGTVKYSLGQVERRMRLLRQQDPTYGPQASSDSLLALPEAAVFLLEREGKLLEAASELQITVTDEEVASDIRDRGSLSADVEPSVYAAELRKQVEDSRLREGEYVRMIRADLLGQKVEDYYRFLAPASEPQVRGQYIFFDDRTKADQALQRLQAGDPFDQVGADLAISSSDGQATTPVDWTPRTGTTSNTDNIQDYLFGAQPDQISDVITIGSFFVIAQLLERDENRALDDRGKRAVALREMNAWLDSLDTKLTIKNDFTTDDALRALNDIL